MVVLRTGPTRKERQLILNKAVILPPRSLEAYWLIARSEAGRTQVLTVDPVGRGKALAVFGFEEEAKMFLYETSGAGWRLRETTAEKLIQMLLGSCAGVGSVALDPWPEIVSQRTVSPVSLSRERFLDHLIKGTRLLASQAGEGTSTEEATGPEEKPVSLPPAYAGVRS